jgi:type IV secretion system protein VirD4
MAELYRLPAQGNARAGGVYPTVVMGLTMTFFLSLWAATEQVAYRCGFAAELGRPMAVPDVAHAGLWKGTACMFLLAATIAACVRSLRSWTVPVLFLAVYTYAIGAFPLYAPWQVLVWWVRFHWSADSAPMWTGAAWTMALVATVGTAGTITAAVQRAKQIGARSDLYGSAEFGTLAQLKSAGLLKQAGIFVGMWALTRWGRTRMVALRDDGPEPTLVVAPNRSGKGVGIVIPNALSWPESLVVLDPKDQENWKASAGWRKQQGHTCLCLDPTSNDGTSARWNPLLEMPAYPYDVAYAQTIARAIMATDEYVRPTADWIHWNNTGEGLLTAVILHVMYAEPNKSLAGCFHLIANPHEKIEKTLERMRMTEHDPDGLRHWQDPITGAPTKTHPVVALRVRAVENKSPNERSSVISTAEAYFNLYSDPVVAGNTQQSDFCVHDLIDPEQPPVSLYITVPTSHLERMKPFIRILFYLLLHHLTNEMQDPALGWAGGQRMQHQAEGAKGRRVLLLLDEFPSLGNMRAFHDTLSVMASFGIKVLILAQDISQLYKAYGKEEAITGNCAVQVAFGPNRVETAQWLSEKCGVRTVYKQQRTYTGGRFQWILPHVIASETEVRRDLLTPDEAMRLPEHVEVMFHRGVPFLAQKIRYYEDEGFRARAKMPPPLESDRLPARAPIWTQHTKVHEVAPTVTSVPWFLKEGEA